MREVREAPGGWRGLVARAMARSLTTFVVPDARMAREAGIDLAAAGLQPVATPRHASVLLVIGDVPPGLADAVTVVYAQMPRPRTVLALGTQMTGLLPAANITVPLNQKGLERGVAQVRARISSQPEASADDVFTAQVLDAADDDDGGMDKGEMHHHEGNDGEHGDEDDDATNPHAGHDMDDSAIDDGDGSMDHGDMDHDMMGGGGMSMVSMTQDLPRSPDGLPMEWSEVAFGPLFPGLPAGLASTLTLDGDTVVDALSSGAMDRAILSSLPGPVASFPDRLVAVDPLAPVAYRILAMKALANVNGASIFPPANVPWVAACERERAASHLGWLAGFGELLGYDWMAAQAAALHLALVRAPDISSIKAIRPDVDRFLRDMSRNPMLRLRLAGIGTLDPGSEASGPVARGSGKRGDARNDDHSSVEAGFYPIVQDAGDVLARFRVRLAEISLSLDMVAGAETLSLPDLSVQADFRGTGWAVVETPRGSATLQIDVQDGHVRTAHVDAPSAVHAKLVSQVVDQAELADALIGIASLDLSPWEMDG